MYLLEAKSLKKAFDGVIALNNGCLCCEEGKVVGLIGANGSGKTTFSKIISGILKPCGGEIFIRGKQVHIKSARDARKHGIVMVHQNLSLVPELTVWQNINLGYEERTSAGFLDSKKAIEKAKEAVEKISPGLSVHELVKDLTPSQKQLVEIAKAISRKPKLLILDEPTASLEHNEVERLFKIIRELKSEGISIIFISHRIWEVTKICDFAVVFRNGATVGTIDFKNDGKDEKQVVSMITGKDENSEGIKRPVEKRVLEEVMLEVKGLTVKNRIKDIGLNVRKGEILGITGLQGQGQEDLLFALSGLIPSEGEIKIQGDKVALKHPADAINKGMFLVPGDRHKEGLFLQHNVFFNLIYPKLALKKKRFLLNFRSLRNECDSVIKSISINPPDREKITRYLSGGNQQKVVVGKWLMHKPKILLLSDPAKGVDIGAKRELYNTISELAQDGMGVVLYASDYEELISVCDRVLVMFEGRVVEEIPGNELCEQRLVSSSLASHNTGSAVDSSDVYAGGMKK
ncbi:MAG: sugar ABC transporter ATP-binding protein [Acetivibrionales bacterium]